MARRSSRQNQVAHREGSSTSSQTHATAGASLFFQYRKLLQGLLIVAAGLWIFWPALHGDWLMDDDLYVTNNPLLRDLTGLGKIWFAPGSFIEYYPIEESALWMLWQLWSTDTLGYHLANIVLHILSALLVWRLLGKLGLRLAWLGGLLFVIHPMAVESVAWISELKNTLSLPPFLLAMCAYIDYENRGKRKDYFLALGLFLVAMLCKISMAAFPAIILLYAWWKRGRIRWSDLKASAPFLAISMALGVVTILAGGSFGQANHLHALAVPLGGFLSRLALVGLSISFYFAQFFWPMTPLPLYPQWSINPPSLMQFLPWPMLGGVFYWIWKKRESWGRHVLLGLGFFSINLAPFLGFISVSYMAFTWVMDHFLYIPMIGLIGLVVAGLGQVGNQLSASIRTCGMGVLAIVMALLTWESHWYAGKFVDQETLWAYTLQHNPDAWIVRYDWGVALVKAGRIPDAIVQYEESLRLSPLQPRPHNNLGSALVQVGRISDAMEQYQEALKLDPDFAEAHYNLSYTLIQSHQFPEAIEEAEKAIKLDPNYGDAYANMGATLLILNRFSDAIEPLQQALRVNPRNVNARYNFGSALLQTGHISEAIAQYEQALTINPNYTDAKKGLARARAMRAANGTK